MALAMLLGTGGARAEGWQVTLSPYLWAAGISGNAAVRRVDVTESASFGDLLDALKLGFMGTAEVRRDRFGASLDLVALVLQQRVDRPAHPFGPGAEGRLGTTILSGLFSYRVVETPRAALDLGAGLRAYWLDLRLDIDPGPGGGRSTSANRQIVDPILALRGEVALGRGFSLTAYGDIGGFGAGSDFTWQAIGTVAWQASERVRAYAGWRHLAVDTRPGQVNLDVSISGPILGVSFRF
jgi:hypothetical protein